MPPGTFFKPRATAYTGSLLMPWQAAGWGMVAVLVLLCLAPLKALPLDVFSWIDKVYHCLAFTELMWWFAIIRPTRTWWRLAFWLLVLAVGIEIAQGFVPYRSASAGDVAADALGIALGAVLALATPAGFPPERSAKCGQFSPEEPAPVHLPDTARDTTRRRP